MLLMRALTNDTSADDGDEKFSIRIQPNHRYLNVTFTVKSEDASRVSGHIFEIVFKWFIYTDFDRHDKAPAGRK